ncbi:hypothetical protein WK57_00030 [Burkholderia ubonensis]|uniref:PD-(D/E)XK motif protein n=1 Tax=Burkholderia ubonensis TaxID=101571 RepID=A0AA40R9I0_9BURK|nr:PD-(D/E)XK motif protein [Burkholderia ubonensis]KWZ59120.1 hypothetical protein WK57_00030 [Burkholderia ubonensis]
MARPSEEFRLAWESLSSNDSAPGWHAITLPSAGSVQLRAGRRSPDNAEAILLGFRSTQLATSQKLPEGQGFAVERAAPETAGRLCLALTRRPAGSAELFSAMVCDVVGALDESAATGASESRLLQLFISRVGAWQEFMRKGSQVLSPEAEIGLVGELTLLRMIIDAGVSPAVAIDSWMGPLDGLQDFELGTGAVEVKTTLSLAGFAAKIGSLAQLDDSTRQPLFLAGVRLRQTETGLCLPDLIAIVLETIKDDTEAIRLLSERLLAAGYFDAHRERYARRLAVSEIRLIEVKDDFPRLTLGHVPIGIIHATYEIDLEKIISDNVAMVDVLKKLGAI